MNSWFSWNADVDTSSGYQAVFLLLRAFGSRLDIHRSLIAWYRCSHMFLLEALAFLNSPVGGGPPIFVFSGTVRGVSRNVRSSSIVVP